LSSLAVVSVKKSVVYQNTCFQVHPRVSLTIVLNSDKMLETFGQPFVCRVQSGNYTQAAELAEKAMALERDELGSRPERMSELYFLIAYVQDEVVLQR